MNTSLSLKRIFARFWASFLKENRNYLHSVLISLALVGLSQETQLVLALILGDSVLVWLKLGGLDVGVAKYKTNVKCNVFVILLIFIYKVES